MQKLLLTETGTLNHWIIPSSGLNLFFKEQDVQIDGELCRRGGVPFSCTTFSQLPGAEPIQSSSNCIETKHSTHEPEEGFESGEHFQSTFLEPWKHEVTVTLMRKKDNTALKHTLSVQALERFAGFTPFTPVYLWIHPYFATFGKPFQIKYGNLFYSSHDGRDFNNPITIRSINDEPLFLRMGHGTIGISFKGGKYTHFCIWSDCSSKYICIAPTLGFENSCTLRTHETILGTCEMIYIPR